MLKRKIEDILENYKSSKTNKCLVVQGARQVGKTFSIREFGKKCYNEVLEINFKETPSAKDIFSGDLDVESMLTAIRFRYPSKQLPAGNTLIFLDEIQECPNAITSLKFWAIDKRFDVIASGSMLGIDYNRPGSYPVGYVDYVKLYGLNFEEFLWAFGITEDMIAGLKKYFEEGTPVPPTIHDSMMNYFRMYIALGGMPEIVNEYVTNRDFREADRLQRSLLQGYQYDIAHYAVAEEKIKAEKCFLSLTRQLLDKGNHKFQYKEIEHGARAQKYFSSIEWLLRADIVRLCRAVTDIRYDLDDYAREDFFRVYTSDLSLLIPMKDFSLKQHIVENTLSGNTKGGIYECAIADILIKKGYSLYFYKNESTKRELDFIIQKDGAIIPVEVKSGNTKATSLNSLMERLNIETAYKFIDGNAGDRESRIVTMPLYMAMFL